MKSKNTKYAGLMRQLIRYFKLQEENVSEQEINESWNDVRQKVRKDNFRQKLRVVMMPLISTAAVAFAILWVNSLSKVNMPDDNLKVSIDSAFDSISDTSEDIQLIVSSDEIIPIEEGATVSYSSDGSIAINEDKVVDQADKKDSEEQYNLIIVPKGKHTNLLLSDGSMLHINAGTRVRYPRFFKEYRREIYVEGEVFLDVKKNEKASFIVKTSHFEVEVLGTAFNVNAYNNDPNAEVVILRGKVKVRDNSDQQVNLQPNDLLSIKNGFIENKKIVDATDYIAWIDGLLICHAEPLGNVFRRLNRYYGQEIIYDPQCANLPMFGKLDMNCPLEEVMRRIAVAAPISYIKEGDTYKVTISQ